MRALALIATVVKKADIQIRLHAAATWFATLEWFRITAGYNVDDRTNSMAEYWIMVSFASVSSHDRYGDVDVSQTPTGERKDMIEEQRELVARIAAYDGLEEDIIETPPKVLINWI